MARFYGTLQGRGVTQRTVCGDSSVHASASGWKGAVKVRVFRNENDLDAYEVWLGPHRDHSGPTRLIASGLLDAGLNHEDG